MIEALGGPAASWPMLVAVVVGYLCGSVPFGLILTRMGGAGDIRSIGSGNIGATNVLRTGRRGLALATLLFDAAKGALPTGIALAWFGPVVAAAVGLGAVLGHCFPIWLNFKGGKGVATAAGVVGVLSPLALLGGLVVFLAAVFSTRFVSLGSMLASIAAPLVAIFLGEHVYVLLFVILGIIVIVKHHQNIARLARGTENKLSFAKKP